MWLTITLVVLAVALVGYVWMRQRRHPVVPGRGLTGEEQRQQGGSFWGNGQM